MATKFTPSAQLLKLLESLKKPSSENNIPYMYVDSVGKITVGVGHNLTAHRDMLSLPFKVKRFKRYPVRGGHTGIAITKNKTLNRTATHTEIKNDYNFLIKFKRLGKYLPTQLRKYTTLELLPSAVNTLFKKDLNNAIAIARAEFGTAFDSYPVTCQAALIDFAFNLGSFKKFNNFVSAIKGTGKYKGKSMSYRWKAAAKESHRYQVSSARNAEIKKWLLNGAANSAKKTKKTSRNVKPTAVTSP